MDLPGEHAKQVTDRGSYEHHGVCIPPHDGGPCMLLAIRSMYTTVLRHVVYQHDRHHNIIIIVLRYCYAGNTTAS